MSKNLKKSLIIFVCLIIINLLFLFLVKYVNVGKTGLEDQTVGLSAVNIKLRDLIGVSKFFNMFSTVIMIIAIIIALAELGLGLYFLIKTKSIDEIPTPIYSLIPTFILTGFVYVFFNWFFVINTRPIYTTGNSSSSYPSTHTLLTLVFLFTAVNVINFIFSYFKKLNDKKKARYICYGILGLLSLLIIITRLLSGQHWFTDIIGGVLMAGLLYQFYQIFNLLLREYRQKNNQEENKAPIEESNVSDDTE